MDKDFLEDETKTITFDLQNAPTSFIYFLIFDGKVIYVGQTKRGLSRPFSHRDKIYTSVKIIPCKDNELDTLESKYILKYSPSYNKKPNFSDAYSIKRISRIVKKELKTQYFSAVDVKKICKILNFNTTNISNVTYISKNDFEKIFDYVKLGKYIKKPYADLPKIYNSIGGK